MSKFRDAVSQADHFPRTSGWRPATSISSPRCRHKVPIACRLHLARGHWPRARETDRPNPPRRLFFSESVCPPAPECDGEWMLARQGREIHFNRPTCRGTHVFDSIWKFSGSVRPAFAARALACVSRRWPAAWRGRRLRAARIYVDRRQKRIFKAPLTKVVVNRTAWPGRAPRPPPAPLAAAERRISSGTPPPRRTPPAGACGRRHRRAAPRSRCRGARA